MEIQTLKHFINGEFIESKNSLSLDAYNPSTGEVITNVPVANESEINEAVAHAKKAAITWGQISLKSRLEIILNFRNLVIKNQDEIIELISLESGKMPDDALGEIHRGLESVDYALAATEKLKGEYSVNVGGNIDVFSMPCPLGVVLAIAPFNFPIMVPFAMTSMALAVGNAVILKPSEKIPQTALFIANLWHEAGLPAGIWTVLNGDHTTAHTLVEHPDIKAIIFVGSTPIAEKVYHTGTAKNKRVAAFGGAKNHMIIMPDADIEAAANAFVGAAYGAASQRCMSISVAMPVGEKTANNFVQALKPKIEALKVGSYKESADYGPLISQESKNNILSMIDATIQAGAELVIDGREHSVTNNPGFYIGPTLFDHVTPDMDAYKKEVFGPLRIITRTNSLDEAITLINDHEFGNGVTIFTDSGSAAKHFKSQIKVGMVGINVPIPIPVGYHNFGGWKRSKFGEGHMFGPDSMRFFTQLKTISERWIKQDKPEEIALSFPSN